MERFKFLVKNKINDLPKASGVYAFKNKKEVIYIGKAINIRNRVKNHFQQPSYRDNLFIYQVNKIGFFETGSEIEALIMEANLIKKYQPKYNVVWRDDKNYFYVAIAQNPKKIPYVFITHQPKKLLTINNKLQIKYVGPFVEGTALKKTVRFLRRAFPYYTTARHPKTKCTWCHLDLCPGPELFENPPSPEASEGLQEYRRNIKKLTLILRGKRSEVLNSLKKEMRGASKENKFEEAGKTRDKIYALEQIMAHTSVIENKNGLPKLDSTKFLAEFLDLEKISRVECYDISNIQGKLATGSMVVFVDGQPDKNLYRKFKITSPAEPNDILMLKETLQRRFSHPEWDYPEVILIDGGIAQLNIAIKTKDLDLKTRPIKIISIAKGKQELFVEGQKKPIPLKNLSQEVYNLIKNLDDEAHRFAITYHRKLRKKHLLD